MKVYFKDANTAKLIDLGPFVKSDMDISPMDIPLNGDVIVDDYGALWEVVRRQHFWTGSTHVMTLFLQRM